MKKINSKKKQLLILSAQTLFCRHGIKRVTVEEICAQAGVSKMTFYKYYTDKMAIARAVLELIFNQSIQKFYELTAEPVPFQHKLEKLLVMITSQIHTVGSSFLEDLMATSCPLHDYFSALQKKTREMTIDFFRAAQEAGGISGEVKMPFLLFMLDRMSELVNHPEFIAMMPDMAERASALATQLFHGFSKTR
jgi:AcrR family transcriptional regulator